MKPTPLDYLVNYLSKSVNGSEPVVVNFVLSFFEPAGFLYFQKDYFERAKTKS